MRRTLTTAASMLLAIALLLGSIPARAGELNLPDPAGDATGLGEVESTPRPSDPELDILGIKYSSDGKELRIDLKMAKIGMPTGSAGYTYRVNYTHGATDYQFLYQVLSVPGYDQPYFVLRAGVDGAEISCRCSGKVNGKTATLEIRADIVSLGKAMKSFDPDAPAFGPGTKIGGLTNYSDRILGLLVAADWAVPKEGTTFTV